MSNLEAIKWFWFQLGQPETKPDENNTDMRRRLLCSTSEDIVYINFDGIYNPQPKQITAQELDQAVRAYDARFPRRSARRQTEWTSPDSTQPTTSIDLTHIIDDIANADKEGTCQASELVKRVMQQNGITVESLRHIGGRHSALLELLSTAVHRTIAKPVFRQVIAELTPDYAKDPDCQRLIDDAYAWKEGPLPYQLRKTLSEVRQQTQETADQTDAAVTTPAKGKCMLFRRNYEEEFASLVKDNKKSLPEVFRMVPRYLQPEAYAAGIAALSCAYGALIGNAVKCRDLSGYLQPARLLIFIISISGGGKSAIRRLLDIIMEPILQKDEQSRQTYEKWKMDKKLKAANKGMQAPPVDVRGVWPADTSAARRLMLAQEAEKAGIIPFCWEDELAGKMLAMRSQGKWNDYSDFLLKAWSGESYKVERAGEDSVSGYVRQASLNVIGGAQDLLIAPLMRAHLWDGLANRFAYIPINTDKWSPIQQVIEFRQADIDLLVKTSTECTGWAAMELKMPKCLAALRTLERQWLEEGRASNDEIVAHPGVRSRALANALRICQVPYAFWLMEGTVKSEPASLVKLCVLYAELLLDTYRFYLGSAHLKAYTQGPDLDAVMAATANAQTENDLIYKELPQVFTRSDLKAKKKGVGDSALRMLINRWLSRELIEKLADGTFRKKDKVSGQ